MEIIEEKQEYKIDHDKGLLHVGIMGEGLGKLFITYCGLRLIAKRIGKDIKPPTCETCIMKKKSIDGR